MKVFNPDAPLPRGEWVVVGSRRPETPDDSRQFFPDEALRATAICVAIPPHSQTRRAINSSALSPVLIRVCRILANRVIYVINVTCTQLSEIAGAQVRLGADAR